MLDAPLVDPIAQAGEPLTAVRRVDENDRRRRRLKLDRRLAAVVRVNERVSATELDRLGMRELALGVEPVRLPELPRVRIRRRVVAAEPETVDAQPLGARVDDEVAPVVRERLEKQPERLAKLDRRKQELMNAAVIVVVTLERRLPRRERLEQRVAQLLRERPTIGRRELAHLSSRAG